MSGDGADRPHVDPLRNAAHWYGVLELRRQEDRNFGEDDSVQDLLVHWVEHCRRGALPADERKSEGGGRGIWLEDPGTGCGRKGVRGVDLRLGCICFLWSEVLRLIHFIRSRKLDQGGNRRQDGGVCQKEDFGWFHYLPSAYLEQ